MDFSFKALRAKIKQAFDWTPVFVAFPKPEYRIYRDKGRVLLGYTVRVRYKYHGTQSHLFGYDDEKFHLVSQEQALDNAIKFYERMQGKVKGR